MNPDPFLGRKNTIARDLYELQPTGNKMTRTKREILAWLIVVACVLIVGSGLAVGLRYSILSCPAVASGTPLSDSVPNTVAIPAY